MSVPLTAKGWRGLAGSCGHCGWEAHQARGGHFVEVVATAPYLPSLLLLLLLLLMGKELQALLAGQGSTSTSPCHQAEAAFILNCWSCQVQHVAVTQ
jgi:hypothetical protein